MKGNIAEPEPLDSGGPNQGRGRMYPRRLAGRFLIRRILLERLPNTKLNRKDPHRKIEFDRMKRSSDNIVIHLCLPKTIPMQGRISCNVLCYAKSRIVGCLCLRKRSRNNTIVHESLCICIFVPFPRVYKKLGSQTKTADVKAITVNLDNPTHPNTIVILLQLRTK